MVRKWAVAVAIALACSACGLGQVGGDLAPGADVGEGDLGPAIDTAQNADAANPDAANQDAKNPDAEPQGDGTAEVDANAQDDGGQAQTDASTTDTPCSAASCDDGDPCTEDSCDDKQTCTHQPADCDDGEPCTADACEVALGCQHTATACDDGDACTADTCAPGTGCDHAQVTCEDGTPCTADSCDSASGCVHLPVDGTACDDGDDCTAADTCAGLTCQGKAIFGAVLLGDAGSHWVGAHAAVDGKVHVFGWQLDKTTPQPVHAWLASDATVVEAPAPLTGTAGIELDSVTSAGPWALLLGHAQVSAYSTRPWYGQVDATGALVHSGYLDAAAADVDGGLPGAARGALVTVGGTQLPRWYLTAGLPAQNGLQRHGFFTIDAGAAPQWHSLGDGQDTCAPLWLGEDSLLGTCATADGVDWFRATYAPDGRITSLQRKAPVVPMTFVAQAALRRADGHVWFLGHQPGSPADHALYGFAADGSLDKITAAPIAKGAQVHGVLPAPDGGAWLLGTQAGKAAVWRLDANGAHAGAVLSLDSTAWSSALVASGGLFLTGDGAVARANPAGAVVCAACDGQSGCGDGNPCTLDVCAGGCSHASTSLCDDGDACTVADTCAASTCSPGGAANCDDGNACTADACASSACSHTPLPDFNDCDDGSPCTTVDKCIGGLCQHTFAVGEGVPCGTDGICSASLQCVTPWASHLSAGGDHTCALSPDGRIHCWGGNSHHELGNPDLEASWWPVEVPGSSNWAPSQVILAAGATCNLAWIGDYASALGWGGTDAMQCNIDGGPFTSTATPQAASSGLPAQPAAIALGALHGCASYASAVVCWGDSAFGQAGGGATPHLGTPIYGVSPQALAAAGNTSCILDTEGRIRCWGEHAQAWADGKSGSAVTPTPVELPGLPTTTLFAIGPDHGCAYSSAKVVRCWGDNDRGQLGTGTQGSVSASGPSIVYLSNITQLAAGDDFTCAVTLDGYVTCWGAGTQGQLGDGKLVDHDLPTPIPNLMGIVEVAAGAKHACARRADGAVFCWGTGGLVGMPASPIPVAIADSLPP